MKTQTRTTKHILFGMLVVTLGFSKSWFQTAEVGSTDLAGRGTPAPRHVRNKAATDVGDQVESVHSQISYEDASGTKKEETIEFELKSKPKRKFNHLTGRFETVTSEHDLIASYKGTEAADGCNCTITIDNLGVDTETPIEEIARVLSERVAESRKKQLADAKAKEEARLAEEKERKEKEEKEKKEAAEREQLIANCEIEIDSSGTKINLTDEGNEKKRQSCLIKKIKKDFPGRENREERVAALEDLMEDFEDSIQEGDRRDRRKALKELSLFTKEVKRNGLLRDRDVKRYIQHFTMGAKHFDRVLTLAESSASSKDATLKLSNNLELDQIAFRYKNMLSYYDRVSQNSDSQLIGESAIRTWADGERGIISLAALAQKSPAEVARMFFNEREGDFNSPTNPANHDQLLSNLRGTRVDVNGMGMSYIPQYLDVNSVNANSMNPNLNPNNNPNSVMFQRGGRAPINGQTYMPNGTRTFTGANMGYNPHMAPPMGYNPQMAPPMGYNPNLRPPNGNLGYNPNMNPRVQPGRPYQPMAPGYRPGGIPPYM